MKLRSASALLLLAGSGAASAQAVDPARDHASILAMQGQYTVDFAFDETVLLQPGYERAAAMRSGGNEVVIVVEDSPHRIVLQHLLVDGKSGHVTKHWRQDWIYEAAHRFEFSAEQTWAVRPVPAAVSKGAWTQCVYEVSDAPRYCGTGTWSYTNNVPTWTSDLGWRPLPRREYTRRSDYNALAVVNRHTLTPNGWTHEQFNTKVQRNADGSQLEIAREFGFNDYLKTTEVDFTPALDYWKGTAPFWAQVRQRWDTFLGRAPGVHLKTRLDGMAMIIPLFEQAEAVKGGAALDEAKIDTVFARFVEPAAIR
ncbi:DUF6607 family protein [Stenotrophomonas sp. JC08]|uniref:DUF6607 family protein n=1 Tax=Stenotrophomonas sp. JC08 TaxID=3445779 RepID=UPI003FA2861E